jgi:broad specificity phosphatase PhoE
MPSQLLWLVRHAESTANVAATHAEESGALEIELLLSDADVPLTDAGVDQAIHLGVWLEEHEPVTAWASPYARAQQTARVALDRAGNPVQLCTDERLRDRDLGVLELLTSRGVDERFPDEAARRRRLGPFWYRPPGGESWADVALRLRTLLPDLVRGEGPVLVVAHDAIVALLVYLCCGMSEQRILDLAAGSALGNASVTTLIHDDEGWWLQRFGAATS